MGPQSVKSSGRARSIEYGEPKWHADAGESHISFAQAKCKVSWDMPREQCENIVDTWPKPQGSVMGSERALLGIIVLGAVGHLATD